MAVSKLLLPKFVARTGWLPKYRLAPLTKLLPLTTSVNVRPPRAAVIGLMLVIFGAGYSTRKDFEPDGPPPGPGVVTETVNVPTLVRLVSGTVACSVALVTVLEDSGTLFHSTTEFATKPVPF